MPDKNGNWIRFRQRVAKVGGDYSFEGEVRSIFTKRSGKRRVVVEDDRGLLFIFSPSQLEQVT